MTKSRLVLLAFVLSLAGCGSSGAGGVPASDAGRGDVASSGRDGTRAPTADAEAEGAAGQDAMPLPIADGAGGSGGEDAAPTSVADAGKDNKVSPPDATNAALFPARLVIFYTPLGTVLDSWRPTTTAQGDFSLTGILTPLQPFRDRILVVDGIDDKTNGSQANLLSTISEVAIKTPFGDPALGNQPIAALMAP